ncbi:MAG: membrane integrity-associated transporter subunit PqiC [Desulfamplus sp.]|nr:membrane integrity-associated transporter subunit PqiC [Desulfamplus sp.]
MHIEIIQLDGKLGGDISISARWDFYKGHTRERLYSGRADFTETAVGDGFENYVAAQSVALGNLSRMIANSFVNNIR